MFGFILFLSFPEIRAKLKIDYVKYEYAVSRRTILKPNFVLMIMMSIELGLMHILAF